MMTVCAGAVKTTSHEVVAQVMAKKIFFVVGCQKSGTTWAQELLNGHESAGCWGEGRFIKLVLAPIGKMMEQFNTGHKVRGASGDTISTTLEKEDFLSVGRSALCVVFAKWAGDRLAHLTHIGEKTPEHVLSMPLLMDVFPQAKFVHVIRDGRDGAVSGWHHNVTRGSAQFRQQFPTFADYAAYFGEHHWVRYIRIAQEFAQMHPDRIHEVRYEALQTEPSVVVKGLLDFLGLAAGDDDVTQCVAAGSFSRLSGGRQPGQEDTGSHFRKGVVGDWREMFDERARRRFEEAAGGMLRELGYE
ncbi:MAG: sulfotransferase [Planctomycetes bacterium]|nr:sulfotransferase [Planctomycetota bacterium]NOG52930.1 sulfotransferase [Planctomycetota bacterium]